METKGSDGCEHTVCCIQVKFVVFKTTVYKKLYLTCWYLVLNMDSKLNWVSRTYSLRSKFLIQLKGWKSMTTT